MIAASGVPFDQGQEQGGALGAQIETAIYQLRAHYDWWSWHAEVLRARRGTGRALASFLPQQHERLQGIARGSGVSLGSLEFLEAVQRVDGTGEAGDFRLHASFEILPELESLMTLRRTDPDVGGIPSVELTAAPWAGCLAGVNAEGVAVVCLEDRGQDDPPLRLLAQDLLLRARALRPGVDHLRRRAAYIGGSGVLLVMDPEGEALRLAFRSGPLDVQPEPRRPVLGLEPTVRVDPVARALVWRDPTGAERELRVTD
jgi:hypothetical protein